MKRKKIAFISDHASPLATLGSVDAGGQNVYVAELALGLEKKGYMVDIYTRREDENIAEIVHMSPNIRVIHISAGPEEIIPKEELFPYMDDFAAHMISFIRSHNISYDLVHAHFWLSGYVAIQIKEELNIPFVITFHALGAVRKIHQGNADKFPAERTNIEQQIIWSAEKVIAECPNDMSDLMNLYHTPPEKIEIIPCGFNPLYFYPVDKEIAKKKTGLDSNSKYLLQLGRIVPRKGIENVIKAFGLIHENLDNYKLIIVGGDLDDIGKDTEINRLHALSRELGIDEKVLFVGNKSRTELKYYYSAAEAFITTPWYEPFGITPLESMACGTPVIGSDVGGISFTVERNKTGMLIPPNDPEKLAEAITTLVADPTTLQIMSARSIERVNTHFTWKKVSEQIAQLYDSCMVQDSALDVLQDLKSYFQQASQVFINASKQLPDKVLSISEKMYEVLQAGNKIMVCGNGGSAAESQHFVAELVGRFQIKHRPGYAVIALTSDTTIITAWANDFSYDDIFKRQVQSLGREGDMLICLSTSGESPNIVNALKEANNIGITTVGLLGKDGGEAINHTDYNIVVPSNDTGRIQEVHLHVIHQLCWLVENKMELPLPMETTEDDSTSKLMAS